MRLLVGVFGGGFGAGVFGEDLGDSVFFGNVFLKVGTKFVVVACVMETVFVAHCYFRVAAVFEKKSKNVEVFVLN